jgi:hypothetical protein
MQLASIWAVGVYGVAIGALVTACGSSDGKRTVRACPDDCPAAQCQEETGLCVSAPDEPSDTMGGQPNEPAEPTAGQPNEPTVEDTTAPTVVVTSPEPGAVLGSTVVFQFEADEPSSFACTLDDQPVDDCEPGITLSDLESGEHTFSVIATDEAGNDSEPAEVTFLVNLPPSIHDLEAIETPEDTSTGEIPFTIGDPDTDLTRLVVTASLDTELPISAAGVFLGGDGAERTLRLSPALNAFGAAVLTIEVSDGFASVTKAVPVTVTPVNDPPVIEDVPDKRVAEHEVLGPVSFRVSDLETAADDLLVTATSNNQAKVPNANIVLAGSGEQRTFTITPVAQQSGPVTISLQVSDGELSATDTFVLTLGSTDDEPTISAIANQTTPEDTAKTVAFTVGDPDTSVATLTPSASFDAGGIVKSISFGGSGANRTFTVTPKANQTGTAPITITISDASGGVSRTFTLTVTPVNDAPTVTPPSNRTINEDTTTGALPFSVADVDSVNVSVSATSSNTALIPNANIVVSPVAGAPGSRNVAVTPVANANGGPVTITLTASDGTLTGSAAFTVTVGPVNDPPTISNIVNRTVEPDTSTGSVAFTIGDIDGDVPLTVTASSSDQRVVPNGSISLGGTGNNRTIAVLPGVNQGGAATITVTVNDGHGGSASDTFVLSAKVKLTGAKVGSGSVVASGTGCPGGTNTCAALPGAGTVTFVATPDPGAVFVNWTGACAGSGNGVVSPIPAAGVTCTANFRNLWARLFHSPSDVAQQVATAPYGVVETPNRLHYLGGVPGRAGDTVAVWNADLLTGAVNANSAFAVTQDGSVLTPVSLLQDGVNGTVALVRANVRNGSGLLWFSDSNALVRATSYEIDGSTVQLVPSGMVRSKDGGLALLEQYHDTSPVAVFPYFGQLTRVDVSGNVIGATLYREALADCAVRPTFRNVTPGALGVDAAGNYLAAASVQSLAVDPSSQYKLNLTLFGADGVPLWGLHVEPTPSDRLILPLAITANGNDFLVTGVISDLKQSYDAFGLSISNTGSINWWSSFGVDGTLEAAFHGAPRGAGYAIAGYAAIAGNGYDLFAAEISANGASVKGVSYGGAGDEAGLWLTNAANGGFNLFGQSITSFGNTLTSTWALRLDSNLRINLQTGSVIGYEPAVESETIAVTKTCVGANTYQQYVPTFHTLNAAATALTIGGAFQANP